MTKGTGYWTNNSSSPYLVIQIRKRWHKTKNLKPNFEKLRKARTRRYRYHQGQSFCGVVGPVCLWQLWLFSFVWLLIGHGLNCCHTTVSKTEWIKRDVLLPLQFPILLEHAMILSSIDFSVEKQHYLPKLLSKGIARTSATVGLSSGF